MVLVLTAAIAEGAALRWLGIVVAMAGLLGEVAVDPDFDAIGARADWRRSSEADVGIVATGRACQCAVNGSAKGISSDPMRTAVHAQRCKAMLWMRKI